jgi:hypothetical protein
MKKYVLCFVKTGDNSDDTTFYLTSPVIFVANDVEAEEMKIAFISSACRLLSEYAALPVSSVKYGELRFSIEELFSS